MPGRRGKCGPDLRALAPPRPAELHIRRDWRRPNSAHRPELPGNSFKPGVLPAPGETVIAKQTDSAIIGTDLEALLRRDGLGDLVTAGVTTKNSVEATVRTAANLGLRVCLAEDACFTFARGDWGGRWRGAEEVDDMLLANLAGQYRAVVSTARLLAD